MRLSHRLGRELIFKEISIRGAGRFGRPVTDLQDRRDSRCFINPHKKSFWQRKKS